MSSAPTISDSAAVLGGTASEHLVREHLDRLLASTQFDASMRSREFLRFVVNEALCGRSATLNQSAIAIAVFGRNRDFDPVLDPIVRVQAGRLRRSLERYYLLHRAGDGVRIELPKGRYAPVFVTTPADANSPDTDAAHATTDVAAGEWPIVLIHPFEVAAVEDARTASRIADELSMELRRHGDVRVVRQSDVDRLALPRSASIRFELRGQLRRKLADSLVSARLIDRSTGEQIWSDEYSTHSPSSGRSVDEIAQLIAARVGSEHGIIVRTLVAECRDSSTRSDSPFDVIVRCYGLLLAQRTSELLPALDALQALTTVQPESFSAWFHTAHLELLDSSLELTDVSRPIEQAIACAYRATTLDPSSARARCVLAASLLVKGEVSCALGEIEQALRLNAQSLAHREVIGWLMALSGAWDRGLELMRDAMERNPYYLPHVRHALWADHLQRGDYEAAYLDALAYRESAFFWPELMAACCLGLLGRGDEAQVTASELLRMKSDFPRRGRTLIGNYIKPPPLRELIEDGLLKAGVRLI